MNFLKLLPPLSSNQTLVKPKFTSCLKRRDFTLPFFQDSPSACVPVLILSCLLLNTYLVMILCLAHQSSVSLSVHILSLQTWVSLPHPGMGVGIEGRVEGTLGLSLPSPCRPPPPVVLSICLRARLSKELFFLAVSALCFHSFFLAGNFGNSSRVFIETVPTEVT